MDPDRLSGNSRRNVDDPVDTLEEVLDDPSSASIWVPTMPAGVAAHPGQVQLMQRCLRRERGERPGGFHVVVSFLHDLVKSLGGDERHKRAEAAALSASGKLAYSGPSTGTGLVFSDGSDVGNGGGTGKGGRGGPFSKHWAERWPSNEALQEALDVQSRLERELAASQSRCTELEAAQRKASAAATAAAAARLKAAEDVAAAPESVVIGGGAATTDESRRERENGGEGARALGAAAASAGAAVDAEEGSELSPPSSGTATSSTGNVGGETTPGDGVDGSSSASAVGSGSSASGGGRREVSGASGDGGQGRDVEVAKTMREVLAARLIEAEQREQNLRRTLEASILEGLLVLHEVGGTFYVI